MPAADTQCYNRGCGKKYDPDENHANACTFHPGAPFFHDAYKGWSCCKKKTVDFTEFLNTKGCTTGFHSDVKPDDLLKPSKPVQRDELIQTSTVPVNKPLPAPVDRPSSEAPMVKLPCTVSASLSQALQQKTDSGAAVAAADPPQGTSCVHSGCTERRGTGVMECQYHSGVPVFHEGMKYWSCCQRKTSDFNAFLSQEGCTVGTHQWTKKTDAADNTGGTRRASTRYDWHQTGTHVYLAVYARGTDPQRSTVEASPVRLRLDISYSDSCIFQLDQQLYGVIDVAGSSVQLLASKVEVKLRKCGAVSWRQLFLPAAAVEDEPAADATETEQCGVAAVSERVDAVDLSDL